jgi:hypothetical protein
MAGGVARLSSMIRAGAAVCGEARPAGRSGCDPLRSGNLAQLPMQISIDWERRNLHKSYGFCTQIKVLRHALFVT